jgi:hypothetical protein
MTDRLTMCPACQRHVFAHERACPFCSAKLDGGGGSVARTATVVAAAVAVGIAASACGGDTPAPQQPNNLPTTTSTTPSPTPPTTGSNTTPTPPNRGDHNPAPVYGGAPPP